ncbi:putative Disease resistance protein family [Hibiscus syriacus]|uniref:Disease resistance protein family n=1 Tax=Hibiscus syriacus TaxID=106335 RepID=A0A6A3BZ52_HIBSY|nr:probable disease resistance protein At5g63020 [Hibiscus syriacus]KAE8721187.1 putative Disease resistance protein family [Hibiscus syriacus]
MGNCLSIQCGFENFIIRGWDSIVGQANYVRKLKQTLATLSAALEEMRVHRNDVQREVELAEQRSLMRLERVQLWLSKAQTMIAEAENLIADGPQEIDNLCLGSCVSKNCVASYKFGKKVAKMLRDIKDHMSKGAFEKVAESQPVASVVVRPDEQPISLESTIDDVWRCIMDKDLGIIGLYGIGGVGKTTLLTQINNKFSTTPNHFDVVIWALVSRDYNVENIQDRIGVKIGVLGGSNKSVEHKAENIYGILRNKRFVVLLDDLWERVDLNKVGIPKPTQENGSKLIFTTRSLEVCGEMEARKIVKVECLKPEEAWKLFQDKVGDETLNSHPDIPKLAEQVAKECGGLPLALITIGRAMVFKTTPGEWKYAIEKLKRSMLPKMEKEVYPLLKFSYDNLTPTMKCCLLYCCLYPEDYQIPTKTLVEYWFCEGLLNEFDRISEAQMQGDHIINSLLSACLLERAEESFDGKEYVKMHDVIRDMCLWIACELEAEEKSFFVKAGAQLFEEPDVKAWDGAKRMSVMQNHIKVLRETPKCANLRTLFLRKNELQVISDDFFQFMPHLTVLDLSVNICLEALPIGISQLISLECIDISRTGLREFPMELKSLTKLKMLDLSDMHSLRKIPQHLISSFSKLQIFRLWYMSEGYQEEDNVLDGDNNEKLIEELKSLQHLKILRIPPIRSMSALERFLSIHLLRCCTEALELRDFRESIVFDVLCLENTERLERLHILLCENMEEMQIGTQHSRVSLITDYTTLFYTLREVRIAKCQKLKDVTWLILAPNLRSVEIVACVKMEEILSKSKLGEVADVVGIPYPTPFMKLENLHLSSLPELKSIYWGALPFPCLNHIHTLNCPKLKKLPLNSDSAKGNHVTIKGLREWWEELEWENDASRRAFLPSLKLF